MVAVSPVSRENYFRGDVNTPVRVSLKKSSLLLRSAALISCLLGLGLLAKGSGSVARASKAWLLAFVSKRDSRCFSTLAMVGLFVSGYLLLRTPSGMLALLPLLGLGCFLFFGEVAHSPSQASSADFEKPRHILQQLTQPKGLSLGGDTLLPWRVLAALHPLAAVTYTPDLTPLRVSERGQFTPGLPGGVTTVWELGLGLTQRAHLSLAARQASGSALLLSSWTRALDQGVSHWDNHLALQRAFLVLGGQGLGFQLQTRLATSEQAGLDLRPATPKLGFGSSLVSFS